MSEQMTVVVLGRDGLTVEDAMRQVLETFEMMSRADPSAAATIEWQLLTATTNSPFKVVAEARARPTSPGVDVVNVARSQKAQFRRCVSELRAGKVPAPWNSQDDRRRAKNWLRRTHDGISSTRIDTDGSDDPIELTAQDALLAEPALERPPTTGKPREQIGSVEGYLTSVLTHYHKPAIRIRERKSGTDVLCLVPEEFRSEVAGGANFDDVWRERRVIVRGRVHYDSSGKIDSVTASTVRAIPSSGVDVIALQDADFTSGLSAEQYLEKLRDGDGG